MSLNHEFDSPNDVELLDRIDGVVLPYYNHHKYGDQYPPAGYDFSKPRIPCDTTPAYMEKTRKYVLKRKSS